MGKYEKYGRKEFKRPYTIHPIWRGIGFLLMILVPIMSYAAARVTLDYALARGVAVPPELIGYPVLPALAYKIPIISTMAYGFSSLNNLYAILLLMLLYLILFSGILSFVYASLYRMFGPPRYTPVDAPPSGHRPKAYKR